MPETVWGRFIKAPQSWKKRRVMATRPLEDGEYFRWRYHLFEVDPSGLLSEEGSVCEEACR
jgi:hypothetical protein